MYQYHPAKSDKFFFKVATPNVFACEVEVFYLMVYYNNLKKIETYLLLSANRKEQ